MKKIKIEINELVPFIAFFIIFVFFAIASEGRMLSSYNLRTILEQSMVTIIAGSGVMFVVAQGSIDLSVGVTLALAGVLASQVAESTGIALLIIPVAMVVGVLLGMLNGYIVSKFKVQSFMVTISMLIGIRGVVNYIQTIVSVDSLPESLKIINAFPVKVTLFIIIMAIMFFLFEYTKLGKYSKAIGENETTVKFVGVPVGRMKIIAFAISGFMAGVAAIFVMASLGGTSTTMGVFFEMQVAMAIYLGGVLVTGGTSAKMYKLILGSLTITIIGNGLALIGMASSEISESVEGILLLVILFFTIYANDKKKKASKKLAEVCETTTA